MTSKLGELEDVRRLIPDGSVVAIGGAWLCNHPMAIVREMIRSGVRDLTVISLVGSIDVDLLIGAGCVRKLIFSFVSLEAFGLAPNFRRSVEGLAIDYEEYSGLALLLALEATGRGVPFLPYNGPFGSDYFAVLPQVYKKIHCPFTDQELVAVRAIKPDVAVLHAQRADPAGNIQTVGLIGPDVEMAKAAARVIVSVEELISAEEVKRSYKNTFLPRFYTDLIIEASFGAHPTSCIPYYVQDGWHLFDYVQAAQTPEGFQGYVERFVNAGEEQYWRTVGGNGKQEKLRRLTEAGRLL